MKTSLAKQEEEIICQCNQITENEIRANIEKNNWTEVEQVTESCEAGNNCGSCHILIQLFIEEHREKNAPEKIADPGAPEEKKGFFSKLFARA